jgi:hypothetical protein
VLTVGPVSEGADGGLTAITGSFAHAHEDLRSQTKKGVMTSAWQLCDGDHRLHTWALKYA